jgi:CYTH domain-containing protein
MELKPEVFFEIELKSVFDREKFDQLNELLNNSEKYKLFNKESITTHFYKADADKTDVRLRHSDETIELVCKKGLVTRICRKEIKIPLSSMDKLEHLQQVLDFLPLDKQLKTLKNKQEFIYDFNGYEYILCLQHIENFAYLLEVEFLAEQDDSQIHEPNLRAILAELDLELINSEKFLKRVDDYKAGKITIDYPV